MLPVTLVEPQAGESSHPCAAEPIVFNDPGPSRSIKTEDTEGGDVHGQVVAQPPRRRGRASTSHVSPSTPIAATQSAPPPDSATNANSCERCVNRGVQCVPFTIHGVCKECNRQKTRCSLSRRGAPSVAPTRGRSRAKSRARSRAQSRTVKNETTQDEEISAQQQGGKRAVTPPHRSIRRMRSVTPPYDARKRQRSPSQPRPTTFRPANIAPRHPSNGESASRFLIIYFRILLFFSVC